MIDNLGGARRANNFLTTLNIKPIDHKNLQKMEKRAGDAICSYSVENQENAAKHAYVTEMRYTLLYNKHHKLFLNNEICFYGLFHNIRVNSLPCKYCVWF